MKFQNDKLITVVSKNKRKKWANMLKRLEKNEYLHYLSRIDV